jgi:hypothetical protein
VYLLKYFILPQSVCVLLGIKFHTFMLLILLNLIHTSVGQNMHFILIKVSGNTISDIRDS